MRELKITQDQYNELCCCGKLAFNYHMVYYIAVLTYFENLAVSLETTTEEKEFIKLVVE